MKKKYRQIIEFSGCNLNDIFHLPCVQSAEKCLIATMGTAAPSIRLTVMSCGKAMAVYPGMLLCEDHIGEWYVKTRSQLEAEEKKE